MNAYFAALEGQTPTNLHALVTSEVERALLMFMMARTGNNKSLTARWLGITRNTLNSKLEQHGIADLYRPSKGEISHA